MIHILHCISINTYNLNELSCYQQLLIASGMVQCKELCDDYGKCYTLDDLKTSKFMEGLYNVIFCSIFGIIAYYILKFMCIKAWECLYHSSASHTSGSQKMCPCFPEQQRLMQSYHLKTQQCLFTMLYTFSITHNMT